jgi:phosphosulfolactate synthase
MDFKLPHLPSRPKKKRETGLTMVMDKGMSVQQTEQFVDACSEYVDLVKFGFGTALVTNKLKDKIRIYKQANITPYFGGTLFELFVVRNTFDEYRKFLETYEMGLTEVSDGSVEIPHDDKLEYIKKLTSDWTVLSEVGSKKAGVEIPPDEWVSMMNKELEAGSWKVITEARESGTIGIYNKDGTANIELIEDIMQHISPEHILWEAPNKKQQVWFIKLLGSNVNLGNIAPDNVIPLETLRLGLRGDTFFDFLPENLKE